MPNHQLCIVKSLWLVLCIAILSSVCRADTLRISNDSLPDVVSLKPYFIAVEDPDGRFNPSQLAQDTRYFSPLSQFNLTQPDNLFWLRADLKTAADLAQAYFCIRFHHLTFVDLYVFEDGVFKSHRKAGAFRAQNGISDEDSRFHFQLQFLPNRSYTLLFQVQHTKKYPPNFDFTLRSTYQDLADSRVLDSINAWLQGAIAILLCYAALSWFINRYRPFLWIVLFLLGIGLYSVSLQPFFIDFFFPMHPETGWLLVPPFLHLGIIGFYLLMLDFLEIKRHHPFLYKLGQYTVCGIILFSAFCVLNNSLTSNYYFTNQLNLLFSVVHFAFISYTLSVLWRKLDASQRFLVYGTFVFALAAIAIVGVSLLMKEKGLLYAPIIANTSMILITILFLTGTNQRLRQHEKEKIAVLEEINLLHQQYSTLVERKVQERTFELQKVNQAMQTQQAALIEKKNQVEVLMDELNHRVKNNLQMLYSLSTLQLPSMQHDTGKQVLNEMRGRIKAMMLVNGHLSKYRERQSIPFYLLVEEIVQHLQQIYDPQEKIALDLDVEAQLHLSSATSLPFGLILTELLTNTFKHAFPVGHPNPRVQIRIGVATGPICFQYQDNGVGSPSLQETTSMGISLIRDLTRQLKGQVRLEHQSGFSYTFTFPNLA